MTAVEAIAISDQTEPNMVLNPNVTNRHLERLEADLLGHPASIDCPLKHHFAPGVYIREIFMPTGSFIVGHQHITRHANVVLCGRARVLIDGKVSELIAPSIFVSEPGVRKVLYILEGMRFATVHPTNTTDLDELEAELIVKSESFMLHESEKQKLLGGAK